MSRNVLKGSSFAEFWKRVLELRGPLSNLARNQADAAPRGAEALPKATLAILQDFRLDAVLEIIPFEFGERDPRRGRGKAVCRARSARPPGPGQLITLDLNDNTSGW
jgi:hypothetical protein